jgi:hypothetical protein
MKAVVAGLLVVLALSLPPVARADIPPPPPLGLKDSPGPQPLSIVLTGLAISVAVALGGFAAFRSGRRALFVPCLMGAVLLLVATGVLTAKASRDLDEQAALRAQYEKSKAGWRSRGPIGPPQQHQQPVHPEVPAAVTALAASPAGFPGNLPWASLAANSQQDGR